MVSVIDRSGAPVAGVAVYAVPAVAAPKPSRPLPRAVMDQRNKQFVPHILVVQAGTLVDFPNSDTVSHHVYSFSPAHPFELPLYKGDPHPPIEFDTPGVVVLGCNIHDNMIGYILVVPTPHFAKTRADGRATLGELPPGTYTVHAWTPRVADANLPQPETLALPQSAAAPLTFRFDTRLFPEQPTDGSGLTWNPY